MQAHKKALEKYPNADHCVFCVNETGTTGTVLFRVILVLEFILNNHTFNLKLFL